MRNIGHLGIISWKTLFVATLITKNINTFHLGFIHWQACVCVYIYIYILSLYKYLRANTIFLEMHGHWACINERNITWIKIWGLFILKLGKKLCVLKISNTRANWDSQCTTLICWIRLTSSQTCQRFYLCILPWVKSTSQNYSGCQFIHSE